MQKENFLSSLQTREAAIKEDIAKDKTTKTQLQAHVKALTARVRLLQKHRLAMELRAQAQQYAAAQHTLEGQANSIKQVRRRKTAAAAALCLRRSPPPSLNAAILPAGRQFALEPRRGRGNRDEAAGSGGDEGDVGITRCGPQGPRGREEGSQP